MSKIQKELCEAAEITELKKDGDRQGFLTRLSLTMDQLPDSQWEKLSKEAQNWVNEAADAVNAKKDLPDFPDVEKEEAPATGRRRVAAEDKKTPYAPKVKDDVKVTTKRGKVITGKIVEMDKEILVLKNTSGDEEELSRDRIESIEPLASAEPAKEEGPRDPKVGDTVTLTTKRGKVVTGDVVEIDDKQVVLKVNGEEEEFDQDRVESIKIEGGRKAESAGSSRRSADKAEPKADAKDDKKEDDGKRTRASNGTVSVGTRIRELIIDDLDAKVDEIGKILKKEGLEFRDNTLSLNYTEMHKTLDLLRKKGLLKK